jgi:flagellar motor switch protein FliG
MKTGDIKMASTLLMLMGEETASNILKHLNESEIEEITKQISSSEITTPQETEKSAEGYIG